MLIQDELKDTFAKINIQGSSLAPLLCKLYSDDEGGSADKHGLHEAKAKALPYSCLAVSDVTDLQAIFGSGTTVGLYDRFVFAPGPKDWHWDHFWSVPPMPHVRPTAVTLRRPQYEKIKAWADVRELRGTTPVGFVRCRLGHRYPGRRP